VKFFTKPAILVGGTQSDAGDVWCRRAVGYDPVRPFAPLIIGEMPRKNRPFPLGRSFQSLEKNVSSSGSVIAASYTLVGAILLLGGIGYLVDRWRGTAPWFLLAGLLLGMVVGFYELAKTVYRR
jgi:putative F0F1-ATPase subunit (Ca2+/Mg2+ transporter)